MSFVTTRQVQDLRNRQPAAVVIDVRIPEDFAVDHIPGALNLCVFEVGFSEQVRRLVPDFAQPIVVYGFGSPSLESTEAARRLQEAGYLAVHNFPGGLAEWKLDGLPTLGDGPRAPAPELNGQVPVDLTETRIEWTGRNLLNRHVGTVGLKSGFLVFERDWLTGGELVIDLATLRCTDLTDPMLNAQLIAHLRSPDFLDATRHPEARLVIRRTAAVPGGRPGTPNLQMLCDLTLRGITRQIPAVAVAGRTPEGRIAAQAALAFDRTDWGSAYGSGKFFQSLGRHLVNDLIEIQVRLVA